MPDDVRGLGRQRAPAVAGAEWRGLPIAMGLAGGIGLLVLVAVAVVFTVGYRVARVNTAELISDKANLVIESIIEQSRAHLDPARQQVEYVAKMIDAGYVDPTDTKELGKLLLGSLAGAPQVSAIGFIDPEIRIVRAFRYHGGGSVRVDDWSDDPQIVRALALSKAAAGAYWGELFVAEHPGQTLLTLWMPVRRNGEFLRGLVAVVSIVELSQLLTTLGGALSGTPFILYDREFVLAHPAYVAGLPRGLTDRRPLPHSSQTQDRVLGALWNPAREWPLEPEFIDEVPTRAIKVDGRQYLFLYRRLDGYGQAPWLVGIYMELAKVGAQVARLELVGQVAAAIFVVALGLGLLLTRSLSRPIRRLSDAASRIRELDLAGVPTLGRGVFRELNEAASAFNTMVDGLRWFETYLPRSLVLRLMRQGGPAAVASEERELTVMFTDIVGFTALAEDLPPTELAAFLNHHFTLIDGCIEAEGGTVDKYIGDAVMAFWGAPESMPDHAERACRAAQAIAKAIAADYTRQYGSGRTPVRLRVGVHMGPVLVGNIGAAGRINYTIIGDTVNTAQRLEALGKGMDDGGHGVLVLVSGEMAERLGAGFPLTSVGAHVLRGRHEPTEVFRLGLGEGNEMT